MAGTLVTGQRSTTNIEQSQRRIDMAAKIMLLEPESAPLVVLSKSLSQNACFNPEFKWQEDELDPRFDTVNHAGGYEAAATSVVVTNGGYYDVQTMIYFPRIAEYARVTAVATNTLTLVRGVGSTAAALLEHEEILIAASAQPEGDASRVARTRNPTLVKNFTQIIRDAWDATATERTSEFETNYDWDYQAMKKGIEHAKNIEYSFMLGRPSEDTSGTNPRRTTGGFDYYVKTNVTDAGGTMAETSFFAALRPMFRYKPGVSKLAFCAQLPIDVLANYPRSKIEVIDQGQTKYGLKITQIISPHGSLNLVTHYLLEGAVLGGQIWVMDTDNVKYRYMKNNVESRDTHLRTNIQAPDVDGRKDEFLTECGLEFGLDKTHGKIINISG
jgi:hypothetical protein